MADKINKSHEAKDTTEEDDFVIKDTTKDEGKSQAAGEPSSVELQQAMSSAEAEAAAPVESEAKPIKNKFLHRFSRKQILLMVSGAVVLLLTILCIVPTTRYGILGLFIKRDVTITLHDSKTNKPVSSVTVAMAGQSATTDANGTATLKSVPVGGKTLTTYKRYYQDLSANETVGITGNNPSFTLTVVATGRQVPVKAVNKISQQAVEGATITADGTSSKTDKNGEAIIVLPADKSEVDAAVTLSGYNNAPIKVTVTEQQDDKNTFSLIPSGTLYFLSKRSGTIDVLKSDLDGSNVQTVLKGTGSESETGTILLASRDWKYLALQSRRDGGDKDKLFLIDTTHNDKLTTIDEGNASFTAIGWYNQYFMYTTIRGDVPVWQPKQIALKSFNAQTEKLTVLDESDAMGDANSHAEQGFGDTYILDKQLLYTKVWFGDSSVAKGKDATVNAIQPDGQGKQTLKDFGPVNSNLQSRLYDPQSVYFQVSSYDPPSKSQFYEYEGGHVNGVNISADTFAKAYPTYLLSPFGNNTFWSESRDGKDLLFVGDPNAQNAKEVTESDSYKPYGWYGDNYLLAAKNNSELYILSRSSPAAAPVKVTDYHKPDVSFLGYGYGYGGF